MYLSFPDCNADDYSYLHRLFLKQGEISSWRRFFPVIHSTWHLDGLVEAMKTEKRDLVTAGLLQNPRWMNRDLSKLLQVYFELEKVDKEAADSLIATIKEGCNTNTFVTAYLKSQTKEEKDLIKTCFQGSTHSWFTNFTAKALASGNVNELGQALCYEVVYGCRKEIISLLIEKGANVNALFNSMAFESNGLTPLMLAICGNQTEIASLLLQQPNLQVNYVDPDGNTALMYAIDQGNEQIVKELLNHSTIDVNLSNRRYYGQFYQGLRFGSRVAFRTGTSPLMFAIIRANGVIRNNIIALLLQHQNINVDYIDSSEKTALITTIILGKKGTLAQLLKEAPHLDVKAGLNFLDTWYFPNKDIYSMIIERVNVDEAFIWALKERRIHDVKRFLPFVDVEFECPKTGDTPLISALRSNFVEAVELLIPRVDINKPHARNKDHPIKYARDECMTLLLLSPYPLRFPYDAAPFWSCIHGKKKEVESWLLQHPKDVNVVVGYRGERDTLLHYAAAKGHLDIVAFLLSKPDINPNLKNAKGDTPLHIAIRNGQEEVVKLLISDKKTDLNVKNKAGDTPLSLAARFKRDVCILDLIRKGAEIDPLAIALSTQTLVEADPSSVLVALIAASKTHRVLPSKNKGKLAQKT